MKLIRHNLKVRRFIDSTYQVIKCYYDLDGNWEDEEVVYQGSLTDCEAYIRLTESGTLI